MNKSKHVFESLLVLLIVILSIPAVSESNNMIPQASSLQLLSTISLDPTSGPAGTTVTITGSLFLPGSVVTISYDGTAVATTPATITTDLSGGFSATFTVPASTAGSHTVSAKDAASNSASAQFTVTTPSVSLNPTSGPTGTSVQVTGSNFVANSGIIVKLDGTNLSTTPATITTTSTGGFTASITILSTSAAGLHNVSATDASANSASAQFNVTATIPSAPTNLSATAVSPSQINLIWTAPTNNGGSAITGYKIERSTDGGTTWGTIVASTVNSWYSNSFLSANTTYTYRVSAINAIGTSLPSSTASATTSPATVPDPPRYLSATTVSPSQINLSWWTPVNTGGSAITGYKIERSTDGGTTWNTIVANTGSVLYINHYSNTGLLPSATYTYRVSAINAIGTSAPSSSASATTSPATTQASISLSPTSGNAGTTVTVIGSNFTANSGITISYDGTAVATTPGTITTSSSGGFSAAFTVPTSAAGSHTVNAKDAASNSASAQFTVTTSTTSTLGVKTQDKNGNTITGFYVSLSQGGTVVASGFSPVNFTVNNGAQYSLAVSDFGNYTFDHWSDTGTTTNPRPISITTDTYITAVYRIAAISLNPSSGTVGTAVTVTGTSFHSSSTITIRYDGATVNTTPSVLTTNSGGNFTGSFTVPSPSSMGSHTVNATDAAAASSTAQFTVTAGPYILLNPSSGPSGTVVKVTGNNFSPNSAITIKYDTSLVNTTPAVITTDSAGSFTGTFTVPSSTTGSHTVSAADASTKSASTQFTVTTTSTLTVNTQDRVGNVITGYFISASQGGTVVASGFSPVTLTLNNNELYSLGAGSYPPYIFDHWQDTGLRDNPRFVSINANTQVAAVYRTTAISLSPSTGPAGTTATVSGNTFSPNSAVTISYDGTAVATNPTTITTDSTGNFTGATFTIPASTGGAHQVQVSDGKGHTYWDSFVVGPSAAITLYQTSGNTGDAVKVTGTHYSPYSQVSIYFDTILLENTVSGDASANPATISTDSTGGFTADIQVPYSTAGAHNVKATDQSNSDAKSLTVKPASLLFNPSTGHTGTTVNFHASGFAANSAITITFDGTPVATTPSPLTTSSEGEAPGSFTIPTSATVGAHQIQISDASGNTYSTSFTVTSTSTPVFSTQNIVTGLGSQTDGIAFIPDNGPGLDGSGAFMVILKNGTVIIVKNMGGTFVKQSVPFVTVPTVQGFAGDDEGLLGIAIDPNWLTTHQVYFYATESINGVLQDQVVRYTATTDSSGNIIADTTKGKELILGIPGALAHNAGHMKFDSQGNLYVATGDQFIIPPGTPAQDLTSLDGKMLRITPLATPGSNGLLYSIPSTNPFVTSTDPTVKKEIYSYGLRNPWTFDIDSQTGKIYVNMVGYNTWESIFDSTTPSNFGWEQYEGPTIGNPENLANYKEPIYWYPHAGLEPTSGFANGLEAITGGAFYHSTGTQYPSQLQGAYFFGDFAIGYIVAVLPTNANPPQVDPATGVPKAQVQTVMSGLTLAPIDMSVWNGKLYYVTLTGSVAVLNYS